MFEDKIHELCGVFGVYNSSEAANLTYLGLYALQHRGQESSGMAVSDTENLTRYTGMGLVNQVFKHPDILNGLNGPHAIGHNRYSTTGSSNLINTQPILIDFKAGQLASAHNGNLVNAAELRKEMENDGSIFTSTTDTEAIMHLVARSKRTTIDEMILDALSHVKGAYSILFLTKDTLYGARDPYGVRPLLLGELNGSFLLSSESCAFDLIGAKTIREVNPGEMIRIKDNKIKSFSIPQFNPANNTAHCVFEFIYFSRPDSFVFGENVDKISSSPVSILCRMLILLLAFPTPQQQQRSVTLRNPIPDSKSALSEITMSAEPLSFLNKPLEILAFVSNSTLLKASLKTGTLLS